MERLTFEGNFCDIALCTNTRGGSICEDGYCSQRKVWERLKYFEDLQEQGRLVVLPCKVGETVYVNRKCLYSDMTYGNSKFEPCEVIGFVKTRKQTLAKIAPHKSQAQNSRYNKRFPLSALGKTVFLTKVEAQAALERMEGRNE